MEYILHQLRTRGGMYLWGYGYHRFGSLVDFIGGSGSDQGGGNLSIRRRSMEFTDWLLRVKKLSGERPTGWQGVIHTAFPTEEERYYAFFTLFEEFLASIPELEPTVPRGAFSSIHFELKLRRINQAERNEIENILDDLANPALKAARTSTAIRGKDWLERNKGLLLRNTFVLIEQWICRGTLWNDAVDKPV